MDKIGVRLKIDVTKIDKSQLFKGKKGTYLDATVFIDPNNPDQYDNNGMITQDLGKDATDKGPILGNCKVFWKEGQESTHNAGMAQAQQVMSDDPCPTCKSVEPNINCPTCSIPF